ncbi:AbrB/MazE/SpoVT family DNA-binding domain-containing protein [Paenibacillus sp. JX-17]|uniref:AbrB/MazE/SpoVT family DNA-binding domain-containing protein n=1 Tax=Paenibacillus lacisoli TaxID=3064525 RepID=A0ABT9CB11_9BACL|nr:AbrB/MazE/SpoVT family DNA-binding domain-containing protein [Paenibacillus sp. JX-17]MDO7906449.1 AbrB/MazE/SpoVT family DNA-binding domain-containing protein [Paenibacillus sp. JX-17]
MKRTGMTRPLDSLGRIVLPKEMRMTMEIEIGDPLEFFIEGKTLMLRKYKSTNCIFCGSIQTDTYFKEQFICSDCAEEMKEAKFVPLEMTKPSEVEQQTPPKKVYRRTDDILGQMKTLMEEHPHSSQKQLAAMLGISQGRVSQLKKLM